MLVGHKKQWEFLEKKLKADQLSHSYLFTGAKNIGKKEFEDEIKKREEEINQLKEKINLMKE